MNRITVGVLVFVAACGGKKDDAPKAAASGSATATASASGTGTASATGATPVTAAAAIKAKAVAAGAGVTCALMDGGGVRCWGRQDAGELGTGRAETQAATPVDVPGVSGAEQLVVGGNPGDSEDSACAIGGGKVWCWGSAQTLPTGADPDGKPKEVATLAGAKQIAFGTGAGFAVMSDGSVTGWGGYNANVFNHLGLGKDKQGADDPTPIPGVTGATAVSGGQNHGCALIGDGTVTCWGYSGAQADPTKVAGAVDVTAIAAQANGDHTCAIDKSKKVMCWDAEMKPQPVAGVDDAIAISSRSSTCAVEGNGSVWCWGDGAPAQVAGLTDAVAISSGQNTTCALKKDGTVACWGDNHFGELGDGTLIDRAAPVAVAGLGDAKLAAVNDGSEHAQEASTAMAWDGLPADCTHDALDVEYKDWHGKLAIASAYAVDESHQGKAWTVYLANYQLDPTKIWDKPRGKQLSLRLSFASLDKSNTPQPVVPGVYSMGAKDKLLIPMANDRAHQVTIVDVGLDGASGGTAEIEHLDDKWICGTIAVKAKDASFSGPFAAAITK